MLRAAATFRSRHFRPVPGKLIRIISDLHYGDRASRVRHLAQLDPLLAGIDELVINGDLIDTRPGPRPQATARLRADVAAFAGRASPVVTLITGNHDADLSPHHALDFAGGLVWATHGDVVFEEIVPWGRDAALIGSRIAAALGELSPDARDRLEQRLAVWRRVAVSIPQRHQSETNRLKYALRFAADTIWPPLRVLRILRAWRDHPVRMVALARRHRPAARFILAGHIHRPSIWRAGTGEIVINTGSFCRPLGGFLVDLTPGALRVRRVVEQEGEFRPGRLVAEFPLAAT